MCYRRYEPFEKLRVDNWSSTFARHLTDVHCFIQSKTRSRYFLTLRAACWTSCICLTFPSFFCSIWYRCKCKGYSCQDGGVIGDGMTLAGKWVILSTERTLLFRYHLCFILFDTILWLFALTLMLCMVRTVGPRERRQRLHYIELPETRDPLDGRGRLCIECFHY